ncbi:hypothetical protein ABL78_6121, partial [Leptomonas seymouri]
MSVLDDIVDVPMSITGEMWLCADSGQPITSGAGRGTKHFIRIENHCIIAYTSRKEQANPVKEIQFRSMKRATWFIHQSKPSVLETKTRVKAVVARRGAAKESSQTPYYYLVLEFVRDAAIPANASLSKREHIVLCTDDKQDFDIWKKFTNLYESAPVPGVTRKSQPLEATAQPVGEVVTVDAEEQATLSSDGDCSEQYGRRALELWRNRCVALLNDFAHLSDPSLQVKSGEQFEDINGRTGLDWDARAEAVVRAVERDMRPALKTLPLSSNDDLAWPYLSAVTTAATSVAELAGRGVTVDEMRSQMSHYKVEMEQFQSAAAELGAYIEGRAVSPQSMSPDALRGYLARVQHYAQSRSSQSVAPKSDIGPSMSSATASLTAWSPLDDELERACRTAVQEFTDRINNSSLVLEEESSRQKAVRQERAPLPQRVDLVITVLLDELARARDTTEKLKAALDRSTLSSYPPPILSLEVNELRKTLNRKELELETLQQQQFDESRRTRNISRWFETAVLLYAEAAQEMIRSQYREYMSLRSLFLSAIWGEVIPDSTTAVDTASHVVGSPSEGGAEGRRSELAVISRASSKLVVSAAHLEAVVALEREREAAKGKQHQLEAVITELDALRQERDEEVSNLKTNFLAAKEAWAKDVAVLQAKLASLQSSIPHRSALPLDSNPDSTEVAGSAPLTTTSTALTTFAVHGEVTAKHKLPHIPYYSPAPAMFSIGQEALAQLAANMAVASNESNVDAGVLSQRFQAFYEWANSTIPPLTERSTYEVSLLEMITGVVNNSYAAIQHTSSILDHPSSTSDEGLRDLLSRYQHESTLFTRLCDIIQMRLLVPAAQAPRYNSDCQGNVDPPIEEKIPQLTFPITQSDLDKLDAYFTEMQNHLQAYRLIRSHSNKEHSSSSTEHLQATSEHRDANIEHTTSQEFKLQRQQNLLIYETRLQHYNTVFETVLAALGVDAGAEEPMSAAVERAAEEAAGRARELEASIEAG